MRGRGRAVPGLIPLPPPRHFGGSFLTDGASLTAASGGRGPVHIRPAAILRPATLDDVVRAVEWARARGVSLVPRGAATGMPGGNVGPGAVLDLTSLDDIAAEGPDTLACGAGAVAGRVADRARAMDRRLPWLPSSAPWCTLGGMVACNAAGARSFAFGATHAHVAWLEVVRADGTAERIESGERGSGPWASLHDRLRAEVGDAVREDWPEVRKNASGYALDRFLPGGDPVALLCGSEGTLGVVTRVGLHTLPRADARAAVLIGLPDAAALGIVAAEADRLGAVACELFGARLLDFIGPDERLEGLRRTGGVALLEFEGTREAVRDAVEAARAVGRGLGGTVVADSPDEVLRLWSIRHAASPAIARAAGNGLRSLQFMEDGVVPTRRLEGYVEGVGAILARHDTDAVVFGHAGDGNLHVNPLVDTTRADWTVRVRSILEDAVDLVTEAGGTLSGEHGDGRLRAPYLERVWGPRLTPAFRTVKRILDPDGLLNPGVVLPLPGQDPLHGLAAGPDLQLTPPRTG